MFKQSMNAPKGMITNYEKGRFPKANCFIQYYDSYYRKTIVIAYDSIDKRDQDFESITDHSCNYLKTNMVRNPKSAEGVK